MSISKKARLGSRLSLTAERRRSESSIGNTLLLDERLMRGSRPKLPQLTSNRLQLQPCCADNIMFCPLQISSQSICQRAHWPFSIGTRHSHPSTRLCDGWLHGQPLRFKCQTTQHPPKSSESFPMKHTGSHWPMEKPAKVSTTAET